LPNVSCNFDYGEAIAGMVVKQCSGENVVGVGILLPTIAGDAYRPPADQVQAYNDDGSPAVVVIAIVCICTVLVAVLGWLVLCKRAKKVQVF
jgi:hypothetical protein